MHIAICNFNSKLEVFNLLNFFVNNPEKEIIDQVYFKVYKNHWPTTLQINKNTYLIYLPLDFSISDLRHQFIHFLQYIKNMYVVHTQTIVSDNFFQSHILNILEHIFKITTSDMDYFNELAEYEPILNDTFDELRSFKEKHYSTLSDHEFACIISDILFKKRFEKDNHYLNKIIEYEYFDDLNNFTNMGINLIVYFNLLNYRITELKNMLFGYFSEELKPKL